jgi:hypothetical protein
MFMKRFLTWILATICVIGLVGCHNSNAASTQEGQPTKQEWEHCFEARIVEVYDNYVLVVPAEGSLEFNSASKIEVPIENIGSCPSPRIGLLIKIAYDGHILETHPARIQNVYSIEVIGETKISVPRLSEIEQYTEEQLTALLYGLSDADLVMTWGEPDSILSDLRGDTWRIDEVGRATVIVYYNNEWHVESVKISLYVEPQEQLEITSAAGTTYIYEKDGFGGDFTITIYEDGTFQYHEGTLSSYIGIGTWTLDEDNVLCLTDQTIKDRTRNNYFKVHDCDLVWLSDESDNFMYIKVLDGEKFSLRQNNAVG